MRANLLRAISRSAHAAHRHHRQQSLFLESQNDLSSTEQRTIMTNIYEGFQLAGEYGGKSAVRHSYPGEQLNINTLINVEIILYVSLL